MKHRFAYRLVAILLILCGLAGGTWGQTPRAADRATRGDSNAEDEAAATVPAWMQSGANVAIIRVEGMIYGFTLQSLERRVQRAQQQGATLIVIEMHTDGGVLLSGLEISKYIKNLEVPTVAWIHDKAYSAGILIASACDAMVMSPSSAVGDCAPIVPGQELAPTERAKALSPLLEEFRDNAQNNGYDYALFHAMCVLGVEVYQIRHKETGEQRLVNQADYRFMVEGEEWRPRRSSSSDDDEPDTPQAQPGTVGQVSRQVSRPEDRGQWELVQQVHDGHTLLTLNQTRALEIGLSKATVRNPQEVGEFLQAQSVVEVKQTWSENLAGWLTSLPVRSVLILALLLGAYIEFQTPGVGLPGLVAVIALAALLGAPFLVGLAEVWHYVLILAGAVLLAVEMFVTPGFGFIGIAGVVLMITGLVLSVVPSGEGPLPTPAPEMYGRLQASLLWTLAGMVGGVIALVLLARHFGSLPLFNRLVLREAQALLAGTAGPGSPTEAVGGDEVVGEGRIHAGDVGHVTSQLRPTGRANFGGQVVDVVSEGAWIETGTPVRVVQIEGNRIIVRADAA